MSEEREASQKRLENSRVNVKVFRFSSEVVEEMYETMTEHGAENLNLLIYPGLDEDSIDNQNLELVDKETGEPCGAYNDSHPCPPFPLEECFGG